jgi:NADPH:quinone reductase-like Zn-dependent oxidoreductase
MDLLQREGHYPVPPQAGPILGVEFSGTIETLGEGCKDGFKGGDEVFGLAYGGAYAEYIAVNTHMLLHKPGHLSWVEAAGVPEVGLLLPSPIPYFKDMQFTDWFHLGRHG